MPAASHVYRTINVYRKFDSGWSRILPFHNFSIHMQYLRHCWGTRQNADFILCCNFAGMDVHDKKTRSFNMSRIKGKNTKPEMLVRNYLFIVSITLDFVLMIEF